MENKEEQTRWNGILKQTIAEAGKDAYNYRKGLRESKGLKFVDKYIDKQRFVNRLFSTAVFASTALLTYFGLADYDPLAATLMAAGAGTIGTILNGVWFFNDDEIHYEYDQNELNARRKREYGEDWKEQLDYWGNPLAKLIGKTLAASYSKKLARRAKVLVMDAIEHGADLSSIKDLDPNEQEKIWRDILNLGDAKFLQYLIDNGLDVKGRIGNKDLNPLIMASIKGDLKMVKCLVKNGAEIDVDKLKMANRWNKILNDQNIISDQVVNYLEDTLATENA